MLCVFIEIQYVIYYIKALNTFNYLKFYGNTFYTYLRYYYYMMKWECIRKEYTRNCNSFGRK